MKTGSPGCGLPQSDPLLRALLLPLFWSFAFDHSSPVPALLILIILRLILLWCTWI